MQIKPQLKLCGANEDQAEFFFFFCQTEDNPAENEATWPDC